MRRLLIPMTVSIVLLWWVFALGFMLSEAHGQNPNPQQNFNAQMQLAAPSLWLNYNDATANFKDSVSGLGFSGVAPGRPAYITQCAAQPSSASTISCVVAATAGNALVIGISLRAGTISAVSDSGGCTPTAATGSSWVNGTNVGAAYICSNVSAGSHTITVTMSASSSYPLLIVQAYAGVVASSPVDGTGSGGFVTSGTSYGSGSMTTTAANDILVGFGVSYNYVQVHSGSPQFTLVGGDGVNTTGAYLVSGAAGSYAFNLTQASDSGGGGALIVALKAAPVSSAPPTLQQPGFDNTNPANYSAAFPYNGFNLAPNNTLGAIDWSTSWTMLMHIDRLNWTRTGTLVLASKGDSSSTANSWWKLTLSASSQPSNVRLCFIRNGPTTSGAVGSVGNQICTNLDAMTNGYNYDIVVTDSGAGTGGALDMYINGLDKNYIPETATSNSYQFGFGAVNLAISGGTGYAASTAFTSTGGGPNCKVSGTIPATGGVPTAGLLLEAYFNNYNTGCTSIPTITLTSPTGTGMVITPSLAGGSMNSTSSPLFVPGSLSAGAYNGIDQGDSTQTSTYVDEFAIFPGVLSATEIQSLYYLTNFYQGVLGTTPQHIPVLVNEITCADYDATTTIAVLIKLHQLGYVNLLGIGVEGDSGLGAAFFRQVLDQAGLNQIPVSMASNSNTIPPGAGGWCSPASVTTYNASTPQSYTGYPSAVSMYRTVLASHPTTPITLLIPTTLMILNDFLKSPADSISPLTGAQLWARNVTNGASMYLEGGPDCVSSTLPVTTPCVGSVTGDNSLIYPSQAQYVLANLGGMPVYLLGGSPAPNGPGALVTRTSKDPLYLASVYISTDGRTAWDSLGTSMLLTGLFGGGVQIGYSGGTGYANETAFTSTGGGANCHVDGYMSASGGVPNGIHTSWGSNYALSEWLPYGHGCTSAPTIILTAPTGTGVSLTAYPSTICGTDTITQPSGVWTDSFSSATCSKQYFVAPSWQVDPTGPGSGAPIYQWFLNSLVNPVPSGQPRAR